MKLKLIFYLSYSDVRYVPAWNGGFIAKLGRRRASISKSICAMLNTGLKSTLYLGVTDEGQVEGFAMTLYQRDHFLLSLQDLLDRYSPSPEPGKVETRFIPVIDEDEKGGILPELRSQDGKSRQLGHAVRDSRYCWCDTDCLAKCANGILPRFFVIGNVQLFEDCCTFCALDGVFKIVFWHFIGSQDTN